MLGGSKPSYIWTVNGSRWFLIGSIAGSRILAEAYGSIAATPWSIPKSVFDADFIEAKDVQFVADLPQIAPIAGYSLRLLRSNYVGSCNNIRRSSDNTNQDIGFQDSYDYDLPAFTAFVAGGSGFCEIWYDQFGVNNPTNVTHADQPLLRPTDGPIGRPCNTFDGATDFLFADGLAAPFSGTEVPFSFISVVRVTSFASTNTWLSIAHSALANPFITQVFNTTPLFKLGRRDNAGTNDSQGTLIPTANTYFIAGCFFDGNDYFLILNGVIEKISAAVLGLISLNQFTLGCLRRSTNSNFLGGEIDEVLVWDEPIGLADMQQVSFNMSQFYGIY